MRLLREDVHIHASPEAVFSSLQAPEVGDWFGEALKQSPADCALPLRVTTAEAPSSLVMAVDGDDGDDSSLSWALHAEATGEVHITVEAAYQPAGGLRSLLEPLLYLPRRKQSVRDALWRLKMLVEGGEADEA